VNKESLEDKKVTLKNKDIITIGERSFRFEFSDPVWLYSLRLCLRARSDSQNSLDDDVFSIDER
jgi:hypothetical protein